MKTSRGLGLAAVVALVLGIGLMIPFEAVLARVVGVVSLLAFIGLGVFAIASPESLGTDDEASDRDRAGS